MKKRKYEAKTPEEILQHASRYLHEMYYVDGWGYHTDEKQAQAIIIALIQKIGDGN